MTQIVHAIILMKGRRSTSGYGALETKSRVVKLNKLKTHDDNLNTNDLYKLSMKLYITIGNIAPIE